MSAAKERIQQIRDDIRELQARAQRVRDLHCRTRGLRCAVCVKHGDMSYPCATLRVLDDINEIDVHQDSVVGDGPQAGAHVILQLDDTVESVNGDHVTLTSGIHVDIPPGKSPFAIALPGWQAGDVVNDGYGDLTRVKRDEDAVWLRADGHIVYDDETSLKSLTPVKLVESWFR